MNLDTSLQNLASNAKNLTSALLTNIEELAFQSVQIRGEFPTSLQLVKDLSKTASQKEPNTTEILSSLSADPLLSIRMVSVANFEHFGNGKEYLTMTDAVKLLGMKKLQDVISNVAEAKNFNAIFLGRAISLTAMQQSLIAGIITTELASCLTRDSQIIEKAYLTGVLTNLPLLTIAFYFPHIYCGLLLDSMDDRVLLEELFYDNLGKSIYDVSVGFAESLSLPKDYTRYCRLSAVRPWDKQIDQNRLADEERIISDCVTIGNYFAHEICHFTGVQGTQNLIYKISKAGTINHRMLEDVLGGLGDKYMDKAARLHLNPVRIPEYLLWFTPDDALSGEVSWKLKLPSINERINPFLYELRACLKTKTERGQFPRLPQAVLCTLNALIKGLNFDRAVFMVYDGFSRTLAVVPSIGSKLLNAKEVVVYLSSEESDKAVVKKAVEQKQAIFNGTPLFEDGHPFVAFPIASGGEVRGVFYADKLRRPDSDALSSSEQISCVAIAEEWFDFPEGFY
ncbi:MAG: HDOD domain-containing protein [Bdellovibrionales bacterium]|nr:HDOD domain-containing protein [Bdellovibrionales bacterium]